MGRARLEQWDAAGPYTAADGDTAYKRRPMNRSRPLIRRRPIPWPPEVELAVPGFEDGKPNNLSGDARPRPNPLPQVSVPPRRGKRPFPRPAATML